MAEPKTADQKAATDKLNQSQRTGNTAAAAAAANLKAEKLTPEEKEAEKKAKFKQIGSARASRIVKDIALLANLANRQSYSYTPEQVSKMFGAIEKQIQTSKAAFEAKEREKTSSVEL